MSEEKNNLPAVTQVIVEGQMKIALTQQELSIQKIQNEINALEFTEDNLPAIAELISKLKKVDKIIEEKHKEVKAPFLEGGKICDAAKKSMLSLTESLRNQLEPKFNALCAAIEKRKKEAEDEKNRTESIKRGIENNVIQFATQIAACETNDQLLAVERSINLEKSPNRKGKYMEFHNLAIERYDTVLLPLLKDQKHKVKEREELLKQMKEAEDADNAQKLDELQSKKDRIDNQILQNQVDVQQNALNQTDSFEITTAEEILPDIKTTNRISFEITDITVAVKKCPELLDVSIKFKDAQKLAMALKEAGTFKEKDEVVINGIRFYVDKTYRP